MGKSEKPQEEDRGLYRRANSKIWWLRYSSNGKQIRISLQTTSKAEAIQRAERERRIGFYERQKAGVEWADAVGQYVQEKLAGTNNCRRWRPRTAESAGSALLAAPSIMGVSSPKQVTVKHLEAYYQHWQEPGETRNQRVPKQYKRNFKTPRKDKYEGKPQPIRKGSECTARTNTAYLQAFLSHLGCLPGRVRFQKGVQKEKREVTVDQDEIKRLILSCGRDDLLFVLLLGFYQGMRRAEIIACRPSWIDLVGGKISIPAKEIQTLADKTQRLWRTKSGKSRSIPLAPRVREFFSQHPEWLDNARPFVLKPEACSKPLRWDPRAPFHAHVKHLKGVTMHTMRHTFISHLANHGAYSATQISAWSGDTLQVIESNYFHSTAPSGGLDAAFSTEDDRAAQVAADARRVASAVEEIRKKNEASGLELKMSAEIVRRTDLIVRAKGNGVSTDRLLELEAELKILIEEFNHTFSRSFELMGDIDSIDCRFLPNKM